MTEETDRDLQVFAAHLKATGLGRGRRSPLFVWMYQRAEVLGRMLDEQRPSLKSMAEAAAKLGLTDGRGKPPTADCFSRTWHKVRAEKGLLRKPAVPAQPAAAAEPLPSASSSPAAVQYADPVSARDQFKARMKPVSIRRD